MSNTHIFEAASSYLQELAELARGAKATDRVGATLSLDEGAERAVQLLLATAGSGKVMAIGNGGSAAIASHLQNDICKAVGLRGLVFNEQPLLTALANDDGYEAVFETPVRLWAETGDVLVAISSSGRSPNILRAAQVGAEQGCEVITLSGFDEDDPLRTLGAVNFYVASGVYGLVENVHGAVTHFMTDRALQIIKGRTDTGAEAKSK